MANIVIGAGGPTGHECVLRLLAATSTPVRAVVRDPSKYADKFPKDSKLEVVAGDVTNAASLEAALKGAKGVIFAASGKGYFSAPSVDFQGVANAATAAKAVGAERFVLVSSLLVTPKNRFNPIRMMLNNFRWGLMDNKFKGENALKASGLSYTIVRPGGLTNEPAGKSTLLTGQGDTGSVAGGRSISRGDVAAVCVEALTNPGANKVSLEVVSKPGLPAGVTYDAHVSSLFTGLKQDPL